MPSLPILPALVRPGTVCVPADGHVRGEAIACLLCQSGTQSMLAGVYGPVHPFSLQCDLSMSKEVGLRLSG
eukprot:2413549-Rhodomonas_salina.1